MRQFIREKKLALNPFMKFIFFIFFVVIFSFFIISFTTSHLKKSSYGAYIIVSESMLPSIKVNDAIFIKHCSEEDLKVGDIITFSSQNSYHGLVVTHRIVSKNYKDGKILFETKGDNNSINDPTMIPFQDIYGKVFFKIPKVGYIQKFLSTPIGFICSIFIPILIVIFMDSYRIVSLIRQKRLLNYDII